MTEPSERTSGTRRWLLSSIGIVAIVFTIGAISSAFSSEPQEEAAPKSDIQLAKESCAAASDYVTVNVSSITIETAGNETPGASVDELGCIIGYLRAPENVVFQMDHTRALDGMQSASWEGYEANWTYHPDNGFALVIEDGIDW